MKLLLVLIILLFTFSIIVFAQSDLYMPLEFQKAYQNKTRSFDGKPGENYWQNYSKYFIDVKVSPVSWLITGHEKVIYINNSNDTLHNLIIKTYPNHYKKGGARDRPVPVEDLTDGIIMNNLKIDSNFINLENTDSIKTNSTFIEIKLSKPIFPHDSILMSVDWKTQLPAVYENRIGAYDSTTAFMGYFYPRIGVYDDIDGWDQYEYLGIQEFYRDYSDYDVNINLPSNYIVWATGELQNKNEVFSKNVLNKLNELKVNSGKVIIHEEGKYSDSNEKFKTWKFKAKNVEDFAAGISDNFKWEASKINVGDETIFSDLVYDPKDSIKLKNLLDFQDSALIYYSNILPGINYPYPKFTTFMGVPARDGMEYPMIANNGLDSTKLDVLDYIATNVHEMAHMYFPYYVGINEVKYSWMEEGMAEFLEMKMMQHFYKDSTSNEKFLKRLIKIYTRGAGKEWETPLIAPSNHLIYSYMQGHQSYDKPAIMYNILMDVLGEKKFLSCYQSYIKRWAGKHPTPYDFIFTFNDVSKQNLDWFWKPWIFEFGYPDLSIEELNDEEVVINKNGRLPVPLDLKLTYKDGKEMIIHKTAAIWSSGKKSYTIKIDNPDELISAELLTEKIPDIDKTNDTLMIDP